MPHREQRVMVREQHSLYDHGVRLIIMKIVLKLALVQDVLFYDHHKLQPKL